jgi:hypothetical protein
MRSSLCAHNSLMRRYSCSRSHLPLKKSTICAWPVTNTERLRQTLSTEYPCATTCGSRLFQAFSASRTFSTADSSVNGGTGGFAVIAVVVVMVVFLFEGWSSCFVHVDVPVYMSGTVRHVDRLVHIIW